MTTKNSSAAVSNEDSSVFDHFASKKGFFIFAVIMVLLVAATFCVSFWFLQKCAQEKATAISTQATVTDIRINSDDTSTNYKIYISFTYEGYTRENAYWGIVDSPNELALGDELSVMIVPDHPPHLYQESGEQIFFGVFTFLLSLFLLLAFGVCLFPPANLNGYQGMMLASFLFFPIGSIFIGGALLLQNLSLGGFLITGLVCLTGGIVLLIIPLLRKKTTKNVIICLLLELLVCALFVGTLYLSQSAHSPADSFYFSSEYSPQQIGQHFS